MRWWWMVAIVALGGAACGQRPAASGVVERTPEQVVSALPTAIIRFTAVPTLTPTPPATPTLPPTPTPTPTPTITPTPTATAERLRVSGDPRVAQLQPPVYSASATCGFVDLFDYPIDPPDAAAVSRGGGDYGIFRSRFDKFHAGEDWRGPSGRPSLGTPVYAIGHGRVTYADPLGWGRDQGVVIVSHQLPDGDEVLSFYGHLDPESIVLAPGRCVARGDEVGRIGRPRSSPHLHFEIRSHSPYAPLTGYWPEHPTAAGWLWPSQVIARQRLVTAPGVRWVVPLSEAATAGAAAAGQSVYLGGDEAIMALDPFAGQRLPALSDVANVVALAYDARHQRLYALDRARVLHALALPSGDQIWQVESAGRGGADVIQLPDGGVMVAGSAGWEAWSATGERLWTAAGRARPSDREVTDRGLWLATAGENPAVWLVAPGLAPIRIAGVGGKAVLGSTDLWVYAVDGLYRQQLAAGDAIATQVYRLPRGTIGRGDIALVPDTGLLLAHVDRADRRLLFFDREGRLLWERSYRDVIDGDVRLPVLDGRPYLMASVGTGNEAFLRLYSIDLADGDLFLLLAAGARAPAAGATWSLPLDNGELLLNIGGSLLARFDPRLAAERLEAAIGSE